MSVMVAIPAALQKMTGAGEKIECDAGSIEDIICELDRRFPGIAGIISEGGRLRKFLNILLNDKDIRYLEKEKTVAKNGDEVSIVVAVADG